MYSARIMWTASILGFLLFLLLWALAWRNQIKLAFGIFVGIFLGVIGAGLIGPIEIEEMPVWLPAVPFGFVALALLLFGILAWVWGEHN